MKIIFQLFVVVCCTGILSAQPGSATFTFLLNSPDARSYAMGETGISLASDNGFALCWNPGQLGRQSLHNNGGFGLFVTSPPSFDVYKETKYSGLSFSAGHSFPKSEHLPMKLGIGIAYTYLNKDYAEDQTVNASNPEDIVYFYPEESVHMYSLGIGVDFQFVNASLGLTYKSIESLLYPFPLYDGGSEGIAKAGAVDIGITAETPLLYALEELTGTSLSLSNNIKPFCNLSFAYARNNIGETVTYISADRTSPLPRTVRNGMGINLGISYNMNEMVWNLADFSWSLDASDLLVNIWDSESSYDSVHGTYTTVRESGWEYREHGSDINFFNDVLLGFANDNIEKRKGWEITAFELFSYRGGKIEDPAGKRLVETEGYGFRLGGLLKMISFFTAEVQLTSVERWLLEHIDALYYHASGESSLPANVESEYEGFLFLIKN